MKYGWLWVLMIILVACGDETDAPLRATPTEETQSIPWQRPQEVLTAQNIRQADVLGVLDGHTDNVFGIAFSANGQRVATIGGDNRIIVWNIANGQSLLSSGDQAIAYAFVLDETLLTLDADNRLQKWGLLDNRSQTVLLENRVSVAHLAPDGTHLVIGDLAGKIHWWDVDSLAETATYEAHPINGVQAIYFSADGNRAITLGREGTLSFWDSQTWRKIQDLEQSLAVPLAIAVSPDATLLALAREETLNIYDMASGGLRNTFSIPPYNAIRQMIFSADNAWLAMGGDLDSVTIFDVQQGDLVVALREHGRNFLEMGFSPDRSLILTSLEGGQVLAWNLTDLIDRPLPEDQLEIQIPRAELDLVPNLRVNRMVFSPAANYVLLADQSGKVYLIGIPD